MGNPDAPSLVPRVSGPVRCEVHGGVRDVGRRHACTAPHGAHVVRETNELCAHREVVGSIHKVPVAGAQREASTASTAATSPRANALASERDLAAGLVPPDEDAARGRAVLLDHDRVRAHVGPASMERLHAPAAQRVRDLVIGAPVGALPGNRKARPPQRRCSGWRCRTRKTGCPTRPGRSPRPRGPRRRLPSRRATHRACRPSPRRRQAGRSSPQRCPPGWRLPHWAAEPLLSEWLQSVGTRRRPRPA